MIYGTIERIEADKGFGFIKDDGGMDWFFVREGVRTGSFDTLWIGERVAFGQEFTRGGPRAIDIHHEEED